MAFDYGLKRVGVAVTDPLQIIANTLETTPTKDILDFVTTYCKNEEVSDFVVGYPYNTGHQANDIAVHIDQFIARLQSLFPAKPVHKMDERYTSKMASATLLLSGVSRKERQKKGNIDAISANLILQSYLERKAQGF